MVAVEAKDKFNGVEKVEEKRKQDCGRASHVDAESYRKLLMVCTHAHEHTHMYGERERERERFMIYYKELAHMIMEAKKSRPKKTSGILLVWALEPWELEELMV